MAGTRQIERIVHFYPRPPRGGRRASRCPGSCPQIFLSTPSARRATWITSKRCSRLSISIHALREEGDLLKDFILDNAHQFLSTPSARRATNRAVVAAVLDVISIHALREEGDVAKCSYKIPEFTFLSTPSARRATRKFVRHRPDRRISIHALREEGDRGVHFLDDGVEVISIHALREEGDTYHG